MKNIVKDTKHYPKRNYYLDYIPKWDDLFRERKKRTEHASLNAKRFCALVKRVCNSLNEFYCSFFEIDGKSFDLYSSTLEIP